MKECRFVMCITTNFGQFVLFCVEFDMCKGLIDFIVLLLMLEVSVRQCPVRHCPVLQFQSTCHVSFSDGIRTDSNFRDFYFNTFFYISLPI